MPSHPAPSAEPGTGGRSARRAGGREDDPDLLREHEADILVDRAELGDVLGATPAEHLDELADEVEEEWLEGVETVGITSGASAPEELVSELVEMFRRRGTEEVAELRAIDEDVRFMLPKQIRVDLAAAGAAR